MVKIYMLLFMLALTGSINYASAGDVQNYIRLQLAQDAINRDETVIFFRDKNSAAYEPMYDAVYFQGNGQVSLASFSSDNKALAINMQPFPKTGTTIGLKVSTKASGIFQLIMKEIIEVPPLFDIWLIDKFKHDSLDMRHHSTYTFNVLKSDTSSFGSNRFKLIIRQNRGFAYRLLFFSARQVSSGLRIADVKGVKVSWDVENEQNYTKFTVERSIDNGKNFKIIDSLVSSKAGAYSIIDKEPVFGANIYRLKQEDFTKTITFSKPVQVTYSKQPDGLITAFTQNKSNVYPNPATDIVNVAVVAKSIKAERYDITVTSMSGSLVKQVTTSQANWQFQVADLLPGVYVVRILNSGDKSLVGYNRFSKR